MTTARDVIAKCLADCAMEPFDEVSSTKYNGDAAFVLACLCSAPDSVRLELAALLNPSTIAHELSKDEIAGLIERLRRKFSFYRDPDNSARWIAHARHVDEDCVEAANALSCLTTPPLPDEIAGVARFAQERGLCTGSEAKPAELFVIERIRELEAERDAIRAKTIKECIEEYHKWNGNTFGLSFPDCIRALAQTDETKAHQGD